ncbi:ATP synthase F1 subunit epsilon [Candidatus Saccharibacteria bacterium CG_4_10_14_0_2_um_filter_52_9]|nr:MAG: ATP synthase F1 subunit epsilon [Candidatus Saccharibacteria bacterium CG_4_10_14_0_2_um_filter_52_9]
MFHFELVALSGKKFDEEVYEVVLPTLDGEIGVLSHHMPLVSVATTGAIMVRRNPKDSDAKREFFATNGGVIEVADNTLRVLVDEADHADELNEAEVQKALERAHKMKAEAKDQVSLEHAQALVDRQAVRLHVAGLKRRHQKR